MSIQQKAAKPYADMRTPFTVDERGAFAEYIIADPQSMPDLALGATVLIEDKRNDETFWIAGRIVGLRAVSPFSPDRENLLYIEDEESDPTAVLEEVSGPHNHQPMIIRVALEQEIIKSSSDEERTFLSHPVQRPPSSRSKLYFPAIIPRSDNDAPSLQEILNIKSRGIALGNVGFGNTPYKSNGRFLTYRWDVDNLDNKHIFIVGESGSGKTVFLKNLAYELRKHNNSFRVILTDVQGDIVQLLLSDIVPILEPKGWQKEVNREDPSEAIKYLEPLQLIVPARPEGHSQNVQALIKLTRNRGVVVREVGLRLQDLSMPSDVEYLYRVSSTQVGLLLDEEAEYLRANDKKVTIANLRDRLNNILNRNNGSQVPSDGGTLYYRSTFYAAFRALKSLESYFDYHQGSLQSEDNPLDYFNFDGTTILFLDELDQDERIMWEMQLVSWLYKHKKDSWKAFVFFDEAHQIIPAKPVGIGAIATFERLRVNFERLAREGRKFGINLVLSTQDPQDLHPIVPEQCPTKIVMKINPRNAKHVFLDNDLAMIASRFGAGQFWIQSPFNGTPDWVRVHSWAPPLPHEPMTQFWNKVVAKAREER